MNFSEPFPPEEAAIREIDWHYSRLAQVLRAASHPIRLEIILLLEDGEVSVGALIDQLELPYALVSHHLGYLRRAHIVSVRKQGTARLYWLEENRLIPLIQQWTAAHQT